jgi:hypothetical protein
MELVGATVLGLVGLYIVGRMLVAAYFRAKYEYLGLVTRKLEGEEEDVEA